MDTTLTIERTTHELDKRFGTLIDLSDLASDGEETRRAKFLTRGIAALAVMALSEANAEAAAASITDGYDDLGLDAVYFESADDTLYVVQSKWCASGHKTIDLGDCNIFLDGVRALIRTDFEKANNRIKKRQSEIRAILMRPDVRITLVIAHTGDNALGDHVDGALKKFLAAQNNVGETEVFTLEVFDLKRVYSHLDASAKKKINLQIGLSEWGTVGEPYRAYYGQMKLSDVADWAVHGKPLFDRNLRFYRGSTDVNNAMDETLGTKPEKFWYFNNGITVLCDSIDKAPLNGEARDWGVFHCSGVSVVNGAQTVGVTWEQAKHNATFFSTSNAKVQVRIISLADCPEDFGNDVTRATNTQNEIKHRDFAALDEVQHRIAYEMALDGRRYAFKSGDIDPADKEGCTIEDATIALVCALSDVTMAVRAKREVGALWRDITRAPYASVFNETTRAQNVWRAVIVMRAVNAALEHMDVSKIERGDQIKVHANRFILHLVFQDAELQPVYRDPSISEDEISTIAVDAAARAFQKVAKAVNAKHPGAYLQPLFKNGEKCRAMFEVEGSEPQSDLFYSLIESAISRSE